MTAPWVNHIPTALDLYKLSHGSFAALEMERQTLEHRLAHVCRDSSELYEAVAELRRVCEEADAMLEEANQIRLRRIEELAHHRSVELARVAFSELWWRVDVRIERRV